MKCPYCGSINTKVIDVRIKETEKLKRRRECLDCNKRYNTYEITETALKELSKGTEILNKIQMIIQGE